MASTYTYDPSKRTYYGVTSDIDLAKKAGVQGQFYDVSKYGDDTKYKDILHAYKTGANPVILGGAGATGGINDQIYARLKQDGGANIERLGGQDRYDVQQNVRTYYNNLLGEYQKQQTRTNAPTYQTPNAKAPGTVDIPKFQHNYNYLSHDDASKRVGQQLEPIYQRALENIKAQKYQNELNAGEQAAKRGIAQSGLAADQQNKIAIAAQGQMANQEAEKASKIAEMSQAMLERDQARGDAQRSQAYQEYMGQMDATFRQNAMEYDRYRDTVGDSRYDYEKEYQRYLDQLGNDRYVDERKYQMDRDAIADRRYTDEKTWREYTYKNMSAGEKAQLEWAKQQYGEDQAWRMFETRYQGELNKSMAQSELDFYKSQGFLTP